MTYQIHQNIVISEPTQQDQPLVLVSRTETFTGTITELKEHYSMLRYDCDNVVRSELDKQFPEAPKTPLVPDNDEIPF